MWRAGSENSQPDDWRRHLAKSTLSHSTHKQQGERRGLAPPPIHYEWQNGEIVKRINSEVVAGLVGHRPSRSRWLGRGLMILGVMAAVLMIGVLGYYRGWLRRAER